jgi:excisionase family DNA binding protein
MQTQEDVLEHLLREIAKLNEKVDRLQGGRMPAMLTFEEAAREMSIGLTVLKRMVKDGAILVIDGVGERRRIPSEEILRFVRSASRATTAQKPASGRKAQPRFDAKAEAAKIRADRKHR